MKKKTVLIIVILLFLTAGLVAGKLFLDDQATQRGEARFLQALSEARSSADNPCLGTSVLRWHSYKELGGMSVGEIKEQILRDSGSC